MKNKNWNYFKLFLTVAIIIGFIVSFWFWPRINLGFSLSVLFAIGAGIYKWGEDSTERRLEPFKTWVNIDLDEKKERLSDTEDKLYAIEDEEYDISQDNSIPHSKDELIHKLKEEKKNIEDRIEKLGKAFLDAKEEIPE